MHGAEDDFRQVYQHLAGELDRDAELTAVGDPDAARPLLEAARNLATDVMEDGREILEFYPLQARIFAALGDELSARDTWRDLLLLAQATVTPETQEHRRMALEALGMPAEEDWEDEEE